MTPHNRNAKKYKYHVRKIVQALITVRTGAPSFRPNSCNTTTPQFEHPRRLVKHAVIESDGDINRRTYTARHRAVGPRARSASPWRLCYSPGLDRVNQKVRARAATDAIGLSRGFSRYLHTTVIQLKSLNDSKRMSIRPPLSAVI